jgi:RecJ-like exonuclease
MKPAVKTALSSIFIDAYRSKFCLKEEDVSALFRLNCAAVYGIGKVSANEKCLKLNETLEILLCAKDANLLGGNKHTLCEGNESLAFLVASKEFSIVEKVEEKYEKSTSHRKVKYCFGNLNVWERP